ncbi:LysR family transcriptional regulator [Shimia sp. R11_0]|uniref:LysR family transcriptional regulator n=1 Tax=Shimia sp. R11_0 TaxID=2821096 RepID=UPI001ADB2B5E|nr:LysR family transcriptional regulator [Shimia sp. R11_0]MBO9477110.1 LysR family transcriptional regulator [Shimia sp. R11_0]
MNAHDLNWDDLRVLSAVIDTKSLSGAAKNLGIDPATVSRRMTRLTETLGLPVYSKHVDGWRPNPDMAQFLDLVAGFHTQLDKALSELHATSLNPSGPISVEAPACIVTGILLPNFKNLTTSAPELNVTLHRSAATTGLGKNDIIITSVQPEQGRLMTQAIGQMTLEAFAPQDTRPEQHAHWIAGREAEDAFHVEDIGETIFGCPATHHLDTFADASRMMFSSGSATVLPRVVAREHAAKLLRVNPTMVKKVPLFLCFHESRKSDPTIRAVTDWIRATFKKEGAACKATFPDPE